MPDLIAQGPDPTNHWRRPLPTGETVVLGRDPAVWTVPWDEFLSRRHVEVLWRNGRLLVRWLAGAMNPLFHNGAPVEVCEVAPGGGFVIGRTVFSVVEGRPPLTPSDGRMLLEARTIGHRELNQLKFRDAPHRLDVLSKLPEVISSATNDEDLFARLVDLLLAGIARADAVALVETEVPGPVELFGPTSYSGPPVKVLHGERRLAGGGKFEPSRRLVVEAVTSQHTVLHVWTSPDAAPDQAYTLQGQFDWAFCTPVPGDGCRGWGLFAAGGFVGDAASTLLGPLQTNELRDDVKFTELVANIVGSLRQVQVLRERQGVFRRFFSPGVLALIAGEDAPRALEPREADVTVLFCDLRGFSRKVEESSGRLLEILNRVSAALGLMTRNILDNHGAIADFLGDSAMGFWGWPINDPVKVERASRAALGIRAAFDAVSGDANHPLSGFRVGVGIASGRAVAGGIGPTEQAKVTVFGPVVNLASRLEGMTRLLRVPILLDEPTAALVRERLPATTARVRRLAKVRPYGLEGALIVSELIPPMGPDSRLTDTDLSNYEAALDAFLIGEWTKAYELLHRLPPQDRGKDLLTGFILQHNHTPPPQWDGVIPLAGK